MWGEDTYISDVLRRVGIEDWSTCRGWYPHAFERLTSLRPIGDRVILPDEPYHFGLTMYPPFLALDVRLVVARSSWYGPSMVGCASLPRLGIEVIDAASAICATMFHVAAR